MDGRVGKATLWKDTETESAQWAGVSSHGSAQHRQSPKPGRRAHWGAERTPVWLEPRHRGRALLPSIPPVPPTQCAPRLKGHDLPLSYSSSQSLCINDVTTSGPNQRSGYHSFFTTTPMANHQILLNVL